MNSEYPSVNPLNNTNQKDEETKEIISNKGRTPPDRFFYTYGLLLLLGLTSLMSPTYIFSANDVGIVLTRKFVDNFSIMNMHWKTC